MASTAALAAGGVALDGCGEAQGLVLCGADGTATGLLREGAMARVTAAVPAPGAEARRQAVMRAQGVALARGVTAVGDMGEPAWSMGPEQPLLDWTGALAAADHDGELLLRVRVRCTIEGSLLLLRVWEVSFVWVVTAVGTLKRHGNRQLTLVLGAFCGERSGANERQIFFSLAVVPADHAVGQGGRVGGD